jgi:hypothetical protein
MRIGVKVGLMFAAAFSIIATSSYILVGNTAFVARFKVGFPTVLACYLIGGLAGGLIIGLFRPLRSTAIGSFFIGTVSSVPLLLCIIVLMLPRSTWYPIGVISGAITAVLMGGGIGAAMHGETKGWTQG